MSRLPGTDLVGALLAGRYRVLRKLGEGAMGAVYLAEHLNIGRKDAIKVLRDNLASDPEAIARFLRGTRNVSSIRHGNVCAIYDFTETEDGLRFVAMEYVDGPTLKDVLEREGPLPVLRAVDIACQVAAALDAAHDVGIVHRDLKPGNIMLVRGRAGADMVKVVDFDIAKGTEGGEEVTRLGFVVGTPEYMSPEQLMGEPLDGRSDVYSLGLVLFRMLTNAHPFRAAGTQDIMIARLTSAPMSLAEAHPGIAFPEALQRALDRALQRKPVDRHASAAEFAKEIRAAVVAVPGPHREPTPPARVAETMQLSTAGVGATPGDAVQSRRNVMLYGGLALAVVALIAATIWLAQRERVDPDLSAVPLSSPPGAVDPEVDSRLPGDTTRVDPGQEGVDPRPAVPPPTPPPTPPPPQGILFASDAEITAVLQRLNQQIMGETRLGEVQLRAARDTLIEAHQQASVAERKRAAARLLVFVESYLGDQDACMRWVTEVGQLGGEAAGLQSVCTGGSS